MANRVRHALSVRQPWAALLAHGLKTVEVRRWATSRRGVILIHAARVPDPRPEAWEHLPESLRCAARLVGGIVGLANLIDCTVYRDSADFASDRNAHRVPPQWFMEKVLYGFRLRDAMPLPFRPFPGWHRFFSVPDATPAAPWTDLPPEGWPYGPGD